MKIGIPGWMVGANSFGVTTPYASFITSFLSGELHVLAPNTRVRDDLDLLLLPGGYDVNPLNYGQIPMFETQNPNVLLESFDRYQLQGYIENGMPVFGICRGLQALNVHFGGTLNQHMWHETNGEDKSATVHQIEILGQMKGSKPLSLKVNSRHHQTIDSLGEGLISLAVHKTFRKDIEAIQHRELPIFAVQFHPEDVYDGNTLSWVYRKILEITKKPERAA